jgi:hypothetical protein
MLRDVPVSCIKPELNINFFDMKRAVDLLVSNTVARKKFHSMLNDMSNSVKKIQSLLQLGNPTITYPEIQLELEFIDRIVESCSSEQSGSNIIRVLREAIMPIRKEIKTSFTEGNLEKRAALLQKTTALYLQQDIIIRTPAINTALRETLTKIKKILPSSEQRLRCFISYSTPISEYKDQEKELESFLTTLHHHLALAGVTPLLDILDCPVGGNMVTFMDKINSSERVIVITTKSLHERLENSSAPSYGSTIQGQLALIRQKLLIDCKLGRPNTVVSILISANTPIDTLASYNTHDWRQNSYLENLNQLLLWICSSLQNNEAYNKIWNDLYDAYPHLKTPIRIGNEQSSSLNTHSPRLFHQTSVGPKNSDDVFTTPRMSSKHS